MDLTDCSFPIPGTLQSALYHNETVNLIGTEDWQAVLRLTKDQMCIGEDDIGNVDDVANIKCAIVCPDSG